MGKKYIGCNFSLGQFSWGAVFLGVIYPRGNYVDDKSSERQFSSGAISKEILSGSNYLWSNCPGAIIQDQSSRGTIILGTIILGSNYPWGNFYQEQLSGGQSSRGQLSGGQLSGGNFPREQLYGHHICVYMYYKYICICAIYIYIHIIYTHCYIYIYMKITGWKSKTEYQGLHTWSSSCYFHTWIIQFTRLLHTASFTHI